MPCTDGGQSEYEERQERTRREQVQRKQEKETKDRLDKLTRMLCVLCAYLDKIGELHDLHSEVKDGTEILGWYEEHKDWDQKRLTAAKKSGLAKLSQDEREALGL